MDFEAFRSLIPKILNVALPGDAAHLKMAPPERKDLIKNLDLSTVNSKKAAILMLVYPSNGSASLVLIRRNSYKGVHSSQIAFPGGKIEPEETAVFAALREAEEEIGVPIAHMEIVRAFSEVYIPPSNFSVFPFLAVCTRSPVFIPDPREVVDVIEMRLSDLVSDSTVVLKRMSTSYSDSIDVPAFIVNDHAVWGATAMMLSEFKEVLKTVS